MGDDQDIQDQNLIDDTVISQAVGSTLRPASPIEPPSSVVYPIIPPTTDPLADASPATAADPPLPAPAGSVPMTPTPTVLPPGSAPSTSLSNGTDTPLDDASDAITDPVAEATLGPTRFSFDDPEPSDTTAPDTTDSTSPSSVEPAVIEAPTPVVDDQPSRFPDESAAPVINLSDVPPISDQQLAEIKSEALHELTPLVDRLDMEPEKLYDIIMEIIQASGDNKLLKPAYDAARRITDPDLKAKALLEVVNEIDYLNRPKD